jgi:DNA segregation ATPase FtsK/SpoIIIE, S-DNA-T family
MAEPVPGRSDPPPELAWIVDLGRRRADRAAAERGEVPALDGGDVDHEAVPVEHEHQGAPVDPPDERRPLYATVTDQQGTRPRPIVPGWARNRQQRRQVARWAAGRGGHEALYHATRTPKYAAKVALYAPAGAVRTVWRVLHWASAEEGNRRLRREAEIRDDPHTWLQLDARRQQQASWRWWVVGAGAVASCAGGGVLASDLVPWWVRVPVLAGLVAGAARAGRPIDRPIVDRVSTRPRYRKLTADLTRKGLLATGLVKRPEDVKFPGEIRRDGPGYLAMVDLPDGVIATDVVDRREQLAGGLRLPLDQVWPEVTPREHPGLLTLWVADRPVSAMRQPPWPLLRDGQTDYFRPFPYGFDPRMRQVPYQLDERNSLFAGVPGSGKSLSARVVLAGAALDPLVTFAGFDLAGRGDFDAFEPLCPPGLFGSGADEGTKQGAMRLLAWLLEQCDRRGPLIKHYAKQGLNSENKLNRAIAMRDARLRPIVAWVDEIQELITDPEIGKIAQWMLTSVIKRGRALGIHLILMTQRIDAQSLPKGVTSNIAVRTCLSVPSHVEVELALGTGMYRAGARPNAFEFGVDAGWGVRVGYGPMVSARAAYLDRAAVEAVCRRGVAMRGGPAGDVDLPPARDVLADLRTIWVPSERGQHWTALAERLAARWPDAYGSLTAEALSAMARAAGVPSVDVKARGERTARKGARFDALTAAIEARQIEED